MNDSQKRARRSLLESKWMQVVGFTAIILLTASTFLLSLENRQLKQELEKILHPQKVDMLNTGDSLATTEVHTLEDSVYFVKSVSSKGKLLVLVSTSCPYCEKSLPLLEDILGHANERGFESILVSIHDVKRTREFVRRHRINSVICVAADSLSVSNFKANAVPQTIMVSPSGIVWNNWIGLIDSLKWTEIIDSIDAKAGSRL